MKKKYLNLSFNSNEFHAIALKFRNLSGKIDNLLNSGKFWEFSKSQQQQLLAKLRSLFEKLSSFNPGYALKMAGAAMCFALISGSANAQPSFLEWEGAENPFTFSTVLGSEYFQIRDGAFADIDGDGDQDAILLTDSGPAFFENNGGIYTENSVDNPFLQPCGSFSYLTGYGTGIDMADFDGDDDLDAIVIDGYSSGRITHYEMVSGVFQYASGNQINSTHSYFFSGGYQAKFGDVDDDGDLDIVGTTYSGGARLGTLYQINSATFSGGYQRPISGYISPAPIGAIHLNMGDMDGDGDDDLFVFGQAPASPGLTAAGGLIDYYENLGSENFNLNSSAIPLPLADMSDTYFPLLADMDGDGDLDVFTPGDGGTPSFQNLTGSAAVPVSPFIALIAFAATGFGLLRRNRKKKIV